MHRKKRSYRSEDVKKLDRERLAREVEGKRTVFAIDVSKEKEYAAIVTEDRRTQVIIRWDLVEETREVVTLLKELPASELVAAMEPTGTYGVPARFDPGISFWCDAGVVRRSSWQLKKKAGRGVCPPWKWFVLPWLKDSQVAVG